MEKRNEIIGRFMAYFDGVSHYIEPESTVSTYGLGLCDLKYDHRDNILTVILRRPGLLIGKGGENFNKLKEYLECDIDIIEKRFN